jgi:hypothetical protein
MREFAGVLVIAQGLMGFAGQVFFDSRWGLLPRWVDWPPLAYLGIAMAGLALLLWGGSAADKKGD